MHHSTNWFLSIVLLTEQSEYCIWIHLLEVSLALITIMPHNNNNNEQWARVCQSPSTKSPSCDLPKSAGQRSALQKIQLVQHRSQDPVQLKAVHLLQDCHLVVFLKTVTFCEELVNVHRPQTGELGVGVRLDFVVFLVAEVLGSASHCTDFYSRIAAGTAQCADAIQDNVECGKCVELLAAVSQWRLFWKRTSTFAAEE